MAADLRVRVHADAFMVCLTHALSTDREEVMGLLIGEVGQHYLKKYDPIKYDAWSNLLNHLLMRHKSEAVIHYTV